MSEEEKEQGEEWWSRGHAVSDGQHNVMERQDEGEERRERRGVTGEERRQGKYERKDKGGES